jgi:hypothetical protein
VTEVGGAAVDVTTNTEFKPFGELTAITFSGSTYTMGDVTFTLDGSWNDNWFFNSVDGYFYCKKAVKPGDSTPLLLASLSVDKTKKDTTYKDVTLEVDIISDSIQTGGGAVSARWGASKITIDSNGALAPQTQS